MATGKFKTKVCKDVGSFQDCELAILRHAVDENQEQIKNEGVRNPEVDAIISILEEFLVTQKLICYGGTAINNILPREAQFYNRDLEIPDYDFYSPKAMDHAIELANIYHTKGYQEVEAKAGVHHGTFKVYVNFIPIADITNIPEVLFGNIQKEAISIAGILYSPPDLLRMNMYLELSRPRGDTSRWEKVLKRLTVLNEYYPFKVGYDCHTVSFQRKMDDIHDDDDDKTLQERIYLKTRDTFIDQGVVFFGGYASSIYSKYMPLKERRIAQRVPDFDVLSENPLRVATIVQERLTDIKVTNCHVVRHDAVGEIIPVHYEIRVGKDIIAHIYEPVACHSYNKINVDGRDVLVGTIDTLLTFYLAFKYANQTYYYPDRIMCMAKFLFDVQQENRLEQRGILKRFSMECIGKQLTLEEIRIEKANKFKEIGDKKGTREYDMWFLKYNPARMTKTRTTECPCTKKSAAAAAAAPTKKAPAAASATATARTTKKRRRKPAAPRNAISKLFA